MPGSVGEDLHDPAARRLEDPGGQGHRPAARAEDVVVVVAALDLGDARRRWRSASVKSIGVPATTASSPVGIRPGVDGRVSVGGEHQLVAEDVAVPGR